MSLSAIVIRSAGCHLGEVNVSSLMCILFSDASCCFDLSLIVQRPAVDGVLCDGHLSLSGLQMRAHAMFSAEGLPPGSDTLEYAWLIDVQAGALTGKVTVPQVCSVKEKCSKSAQRKKTKQCIIEWINVNTSKG